jgi:GT2 family glycosyltransferase
VRFSVVIATRGRPESLRTTLESLAACSTSPDEVVIVDGDEARSAEPVADAVREAFSVPVRHVASPPGLTRQRNAGIRAAHGEVIVFADDDVAFDPGVLSALATAYADPAVVGATGRIVEHEPRRVGGARSGLRRSLQLKGDQGTMTSYGYPRRLIDLDVGRDVEFMHGCLMSARRDAALATGFDEGLPGYGLAEDEDFGYRLSRAGRVRYVPSASVVHLARGRGGAAQRAFNRTLVIHRAYLLRKNFAPGRLAWIRFVGMLALLVAHRAANGEWQGVRGLAEGALAAARGRRPDDP